MSSRGLPGQGPSFVPAYQVSGTPFVTSSLAGAPLQEGGTAVDADKHRVIKFPRVTRWVQVRNIGSSSLRVGFTKNGVSGSEGGQPTDNYYLLNPSINAAGHSTSQTVRWEVRCKELHVRLHGLGGTHFSVMAGLTGIEEFPTLTGSNGFQGVG